MAGVALVTVFADIDGRDETTTGALRYRERVNQAG